MMRQIVVIGAGPGGLCAASELTCLGHRITVVERHRSSIGGLATTLRWGKYRFDIGAHRFFSKNPDIVRWWRQRLPNDFIRIKRLTRILYRKRLFRYPLRGSDALKKLGVRTSTACLASYLWRRISPVSPECSFENWVVNRFGDRLYRIFFKTYTEKVWGMSCSEISADWASQRIKGLSLWEAVRCAVTGNRGGANTAKTLIDEFDYPRLGAGMLWEKVRDEIVARGGSVFMDRMVKAIRMSGNRVLSVLTERSTGEVEEWAGDNFIVSMPLRDCVLAMNPELSPEAREAARRLRYRDFLLVALIVNRRDLFPDQWIYVHSPEVKVARIENFNNWGDEMNPNRDVTCLELEYFCSQHETLWKMGDEAVIALAKKELEILGLARSEEVIDGCVVRVEKAYPVYDQDYRENVTVIRRHLEQIGNLQVVGRNGMHKYNNQDHSMLTGMFAARNVSGSKYDVWRVNTDAEYQEDGPLPDDSARLMPRPIGETEESSDSR